MNNRNDIGIYPLKQFAHVIHGNPNAQGRTAMGSPPSSRVVLREIKLGLLMMQ
jgi:hypothetical protein